MSIIAKFTICQDSASNTNNDQNDQWFRLLSISPLVLTSGTQKSGTHECTPKSGSEAGVPLLLSKERESGAALNFFGSEEFEWFLAFQPQKC